MALLKTELNHLSERAMKSPITVEKALNDLFIAPLSEEGATFLGYSYLNPFSVLSHFDVHIVTLTFKGALEIGDIPPWLKSEDNDYWKYTYETWGDLLIITIMYIL